MGIKRWSLGQCTQVVVSNPENRNFARERLGVDCLVLPDPLPELTARRSLGAAAAAAHRSGAPIVFIMSFAPDEPIPLASSTAQALRSMHPVVFTGDPSHLSAGARRSLEGSGKLSGYIPEQEYWALLRSSAAIVVLTTEPACLPCGAYEAIALGRRPVLLEDARARDFFRGYAIFSEPDRDVLVSAIELACSQKGHLGGEDIAEYEESWRKSWEEVSSRF
jgi:hypothetical protein